MIDAIEYLRRRFGRGLEVRCDIDRNGLADMFFELGFKAGAEIGVQRGRYSEVLCRANPGLELNCVDMWSLRGDRGFEWYKEAKERLDRYNVRFFDKLSVDAVREIPDQSLDFVHIDASHLFDDLAVDLVLWAKKVRIGGIVSGHDYMKYSPKMEKQWWGSIWAVEAYTKAHFLEDWYITYGEEKPSYFWVKDFEQGTAYD